MCGFAGFRLVQQGLSTHPEQLLTKMADVITHRGPDDDGIWFDNTHNVGLCHRRLAIQDLSPLGAQPMRSSSGRYVIAFNGEIYNFLELKQTLEISGVTFQGHSDTEVMLACFEKWGLLSALEKFEGMFAFALVDRQENSLHLARDRMGEKPLYYGLQKNNAFVFGSELKSLRCLPDFDGEIDRDALALLLRHNYIPAPYSIYKSVRKLEPGSVLTLSLNSNHGEPSIERYWDLPSIYSSTNIITDRQYAENELERLIKRSIKQQMISDVPLGAFLSGGVDSSAVVALMQEQSNRPVKTFSIGFNEPKYNEAEFAKSVAQHLKTDHTEFYVDAHDTLNVIPDLPTMFDEPFADSSQIPTYLVCKMAKKEVTVALSGDGGDELFCGYERFFSNVKRWSNSQNPSLVELIKQLLINKVPPSIFASVIQAVVPSQKHLSKPHIIEKLLTNKSIASATSLQEQYTSSISYWANPSVLVKGAKESKTFLNSQSVEGCNGDLYRELMLLDTGSYLPDDILVKVDRAAMFTSLETRVPFLNHKIVEFAASIDSSLNTDGITGKHLLRSILYKYVPKSLIERPKRGFAVPLEYWLRSDLKQWAADLLQEDKIKREGFFDEKVVSRLWSEHQSGLVDHSFHLWGILTFQAWLENTANSSLGGNL